MIPARRRRYDRTRYKLRNVVERFFNRVKHYRRVATRYDKTDHNYFGFVCLASYMTAVLCMSTRPSNRIAALLWKQVTKHHIPSCQLAVLAFNPRLKQRFL